MGIEVEDGVDPDFLFSPGVEQSLDIQSFRQQSRMERNTILVLDPNGE